MGSETVTLPNTLPSSLRIELIADPRVRQLIEEEKELREKRKFLREELQKVMHAKSKSLAAHIPKLDNFNAEMNTTINALSLKKNELFREIDSIKSIQSDLAEIRQEMQATRFTCSQLSREIQDKELILKDDARELERLREERLAMTSRMRFTTLEQINNEIQRIDRELSNNNNNNNNNNILLSRKALAEKSKNDLQSLIAIDRRIEAMLSRVQKSRAEIDTKTLEKQSAEEKQILLRTKLQATSSNQEERSTRFAVLKDDLSNVQRELREALRSRREKRPVNDEVQVLQQSHESYSAEIRTIDNRLNELRTEVPFHTFTCTSQLRPALIGKGGATLEQLQLDFGVAICIDGNNNNNSDSSRGLVIGGATDVAAAAIAIAEITTAETQYRAHELLLKYDTNLRKKIVGTRGANVQRIERESGASISVDEGTITLRGTSVAVEAAQILILKFIENQHRAELSFDIDELPLVIGKEGAIIRRVEEETGVRKIYVDRVTKKLIVTGEKKRVEEAISHYEALLADIRNSKLVIRCDEAMQRYVVGAKGRTVREIEESTGALVRVQDGSIILKGTSQSVNAARVMLHELRRIEARVSLDREILRLLTSFLVEIGNNNSSTTSSSNAGFSPSSQLEPNGETEEEELEEEEQEKEEETKKKRDNNKKKKKDENGKSTVTLLTPLQAIQNISHCEYMTPLFAEGIILLRGKSDNVNQARAMLEDFSFRFHPQSIEIRFPRAIFPSLINSRGADPSLVSELTSTHAPLLRVQLKREEGLAVVTAPLTDIVKLAAEKLREFIAAVEVSKLRRVTELTPQHIAALTALLPSIEIKTTEVNNVIGEINNENNNSSNNRKKNNNNNNGSRIVSNSRLMEIENRTGTHIVLLRALREVQVFHEEGDDTALMEAVDAIMELVK